MRGYREGAQPHWTCLNLHPRLRSGPLERQSGLHPFGAGDAFVAGLLWGLEEGETADALRCAAVAAATKCSIRGDHLLTSRAEFLELLAASKIEVLR